MIEYIDDYRNGISMVIEKFNPHNILELGAGGNSTPIFIGVCPSVISIDLKFGEWSIKYKECDNWASLEGDDIQFLNQMLDSGIEFDLIYIDSSHEFGHTAQELELSAQLLSDGGVILMHDVSWSGVNQAIEEFMYENEDFEFVKWPLSDFGIVREKGGIRIP